MNDATLYRRPLPSDAIPFSSPEGRQLFAEALAAGGLDGYFPLAEQFHTQSDPAFCGLGSLVVALNALGIDPGRLWKGPWRWFAEDLLDCCVPLSEVQKRGLDLDELTCLSRCNGAEVELERADTADVTAFRSAVARAARGEEVIIAAYDRALLGQSGSGHFSPIGGYHAQRDLVLVLDVARFKYPPHWVSTPRLFEAMRSRDPITGRARGWMVLRARLHGVALGFSLRCEGDNFRTLLGRLAQMLGSLDAVTELDTLAEAVAPLATHLELRPANTEAHQVALALARAELAADPVYPVVLAAVGPERAEVSTLLVLALAELLAPAQRAHLEELTRPRPDALAAEIDNLSAQLSALQDHAQQAPSHGSQMK